MAHDVASRAISSIFANPYMRRHNAAAAMAAMLRHVREHVSGDVEPAAEWAIDVLHRYSVFTADDDEIDAALCAVKSAMGANNGHATHAALKAIMFACLAVKGRHVWAQRALRSVFVVYYTTLRAQYGKCISAKQFLRMTWECEHAFDTLLATSINTASIMASR